jgi:hypothetical protein
MPPSAWSGNGSFRRRNQASFQSQPYLQQTNPGPAPQRLKKFNVSNTGPIPNLSQSNASSNGSTSSTPSTSSNENGSAFNGGAYHSTFRDIDKMSDESSTQTNITNELTINETSGSSTENDSSGEDNRKSSKNKRLSADSDILRPNESDSPNGSGSSSSSGKPMQSVNVRLKSYENSEHEQSNGNDDDEKVEVLIGRDAKHKDFGFSIADSLYGQGVYVSKIRAGSLAEQNLYLKVNTKIFKVSYFQDKS